MSGFSADTKGQGHESDTTTLGRVSDVARRPGSDMSSSSNEKQGDHTNGLASSPDKWKVPLLQELETFANMMSSADAMKCSKKLRQFSDQIIRVIEELEIIDDSITTLFPQSNIASSSSNVREILVALVCSFASAAERRFRGSDMSKFAQKVRHRLVPAADEKKMEPGHEEAHDVSRTSNKLLRYPTNTLLDLLYDSLTYLSKDLNTFTYYMKVSANAEMDKVQSSIVAISAFCRPWTRPNNPRRFRFSSAYDYEVMQEIAPLLDGLCDALGNFLVRKNGLPGIKEQHEKNIENESLALLSVATFFTSITASTLALSFSQKSTLYDVVNFFWFTSLVFSIASVLNSLLALTWKHSIFRTRSPDEKLPPLIALWSRKSPFYFLSFAALCFIVGLCLLAFASNQRVWTSAVTTTLTCLSFLGITAATIWFVVERHNYEHRGVDEDEIGLLIGSSDPLMVPAPVLRQHSSIKGVKTHVTMDKVIGALKSIKAEELPLAENLGPLFGISYSLDGSLLGITSSTELGLYSVQDHVLLQAIVPDSSSGMISSSEEHYKGAVIWSPSCKSFLLRTSDGVQVWEKEDGLSANFQLMITVTDYLSDDAEESSLAWLPTGDAFSKVSGASVKTYYKGSGDWSTVLEGSLTHSDPSTRDDLLVVYDVAVTGERNENARMLIGAKSSATIKDINSTTLRGVVRNELIVYNLERHEVESRIPLFDFPRSLSLSKNQQELLIGYATKPLQLWDISNAREIHLARTYEYPSRTNFSESCALGPYKGQAFFCGTDDFLVACLDRKNSLFQVWDKEKCVHLCVVDGGMKEATTSIKTVAVNRSAPSLMLVTELSDGTVMTWSRAKRDVKQEKDEGPK